MIVLALAETFDFFIFFQLILGAGGPDMGVSWYRNGRLVESRVEHRIHDYFYHLHLRSVSRSEHRVTFTCQLELDVQPPVPPVFRNVTLNIRCKYLIIEHLFICSL